MNDIFDNLISLSELQDSRILFVCFEKALKPNSHNNYCTFNCRKFVLIVKRSKESMIVELCRCKSQTSGNLIKCNLEIVNIGSFSLKSARLSGTLPETTSLPHHLSDN